ncbi:MAG: fumarylacetoacetate hydrolase family protein [Phycisphaeraceae bacterium]
MILLRTTQGPMLRQHGEIFPIDGWSWLDLINRDDLPALLSKLVSGGTIHGTADFVSESILPPIDDRQELWAAGVTYMRSKTARMEEASASTGGGGGSDFYDKVYHADRPELFFKATPHRVAGHHQAMHLRSDSKWIVPEPELTLVITRNGNIIGYTVGNDLSCRDIEGENPLYLPQAKTFDRCAALGPGVYISEKPLAPTTAIKLEITRAGKAVFTGATSIDQIKKPLPTLVEYLFRDNSFPHGCLLMTGTGIVPPNDFSLQMGDTVRISIDSIGTLVNMMET